MRAIPIALVLLGLCCCGEPEAAPGVVVGARVQVFSPDDLRGLYAIEAVEGSRARCRRGYATTWIDFSQVARYEVR